MNKTPVFYDIFKSPLGPIYLIFSGHKLSGVSFAKPSGISYRKNSAPAKFISEITKYFQGSGNGFTRKIDFLSGTEFEKQVWLALNDIPFGETRSYKWVAEKIGRPAAVRAVGRALSKNPVPVVIPCHRVIESDGSIGGYSSGADIKIRLLEMEYYAKMNK